MSDPQAHFDYQLDHDPEMMAEANRGSRFLIVLLIIIGLAAIVLIGIPMAVNEVSTSLSVREECAMSGHTAQLYDEGWYCVKYDGTGKLISIFPIALYAK